MKKIYLYLTILLVCFITSCNLKDKEIKLDNSNPLALAPDIEWAVVEETYVAFRKNMDWNSEVTGHCRRGEILQVVGTNYADSENYWYKFYLGWLPGSAVSIYSNRLKAEAAAKLLK